MTTSLKNGLKSALIGVPALALWGCAEGPAPTASDAPDPATTFVSLNPCLDAILLEVAAEPQILALSHYSRDPAASSVDVDVALQFGSTGGTAEEIIALQPDIVLASQFIAPATKSALERAGLRVETFGSPTNVAQSIEQIRAIADLAGDEAKSDALIFELTEASPFTDRPPISALLWQPGQIVAGEASLVAEHLAWAGFESHSAQLGLGQADHITLEQILSNPPRLLLVAGESPGQTHPLLTRSRTTMTAEFAPGLFYCAGPSIPKARARLAEIRAEFERTRTMAPQ